MSTVPALVTNLLADTTNFDAALDKSGRKVQVFSKEVEKAGKAASKISAGLAVADIAGLEKLTAGSKMARAAVEGLTGALMLLGRIPLPLAIGVAAAGALATFVMRGDEAAKKADEVAQRLDNLKKSAVELATAPVELDRLFASSKATGLESTLADLKKQRENLAQGLNEEGMKSSGAVKAIDEQVKAVTAELEVWRQREKVAYDKILAVRKEFTDKAAKATGGDNDALGAFGEEVAKADAQLRALIQTTEQAAAKQAGGAEAAMRYALTQGELAGQVQLAGEKGKEYAARLIDLAKAQDDAANAARNHKTAEDALKQSLEDAKESASRFSDEQRKALEFEMSLLSDAERAYLKYQQTRDAINKRAADGIIDPDQQRDELKRAEAQFAASTKKMSTYADQAARNMQTAFAEFLFDPFKEGLDGMLRSFLQTIQRMIAEQAAAKLFGPTSEGGLGWGDAIAAIFAGGFAKGGTIPAGKFGVVGENGPELAVGPQTIIPPDKIPQRDSAAAPIFNLPAIELPDIILQPAPSRDSPLEFAAPANTTVHMGDVHLTINGGADAGVMPQVVALLAENNRQQEKKIKRFLSRGI